MPQLSFLENHQDGNITCGYIVKLNKGFIGSIIHLHLILNRLLKYDPRTKSSTVLMREIHFANGVQLSQNEDFVLVSETAKSRVLRYVK